MTEKKSKNEKNLLLDSNIKNKEENKLKIELFSVINNIKNLLEKNILQNGALLMKKINILLIKITSLFETLLKDNELIQIYELILRKHENTIRKLYNNIFYLKSTIDYQENTIVNFITKEKEFEKLKERTGAFYSNGKLIYNGRKDNEIMILRTENSNLKSFIENKEKDLKEKDNEINKLKEQILLFNKNTKNNDKKKFKNKNNSLPNINDLKCTYSNININFNEINNSNSIMHKNENKSSGGFLTGKSIYAPPQLRNDLSFKELFKKRNKYNLYHHKKIKRNKNFSTNLNNRKLNILNNADKYISVNKSNYKLLTSKRHDKFFSNTINPDVNSVTFSDYYSPSNDNNKKVLNLKSYIEKELTQKKANNLVNKIINKIQFSYPGKKSPFYASPMIKYSKNKLFLK